MTEQLWRAAASLGRTPELHYLEYPRLKTGAGDGPLAGHGVPRVVPGLDAANVVCASFRIARRIRPARTRFVCAAVASHGYAAALTGKPYGCWIATSLSDEWASRRHGVGAARTAARFAGAPVLGACERATLRRATVRWTISPAAREALCEAAGLPETAIRVVPIPVDTVRFTPVPDADWEKTLDAPELMFVGRASDPRKNLDLLLRAYERLRERLPGSRLTLVGEPPSGSLPPGVKATGTVPSVADLLPRASLFVLPSLQEGFGIVVAEALASGVPVLVTPCGGPEELVRSSGGGEVLSTFDPDELVERALALLTDANLLREMRRLGREYVVREHDPARLCAELEEAFRTLDDAS
jgi:glycosyltransferase involved in cell wall biosynthesis